MAEQPPTQNPKEQNIAAFAREHSILRGGNPEWRHQLKEFMRQHSIFTREDPAAQERKEKTGGSLWGSSFAAVGAGGLGAGVLLGEALKMAMKVDFDAHGINAANEDATKMFSKGYDWAYGKKKAA